MADDEDRERDGTEKQDKSHLAVDGALITRSDHGPRVPYGPNPCSDVGEGHQNKPVQAKGSKGIPRFDPVWLAVSAKNYVDGQER